jgi:hypothetical protein
MLRSWWTSFLGLQEGFDGVRFEQVRATLDELIRFYREKGAGSVPGFWSWSRDHTDFKKQRDLYGNLRDAVKKALQSSLELKTWWRLGFVIGNEEYMGGDTYCKPAGMTSLLLIIHSLSKDATAVPELVALAERTAEYDEDDQMALLKQVLGCAGIESDEWRTSRSTPLERGLWAVLDARIEAAFEPAEQKTHATGSHQGTSKTTSPNLAEQEPVFLTQSMGRVLDALDGRSLTGDALARRLHTDKSGLQRRTLKPLMMAGMIKNSRRAGGYYRPDALDPKVAKKLSVQHCSPPRTTTEAPPEAPTA